MCDVKERKERTEPKTTTTTTTIFFLYLHIFWQQHYITNSSRLTCKPDWTFDSVNCNNHCTYILHTVYNLSDYKALKTALGVTHGYIKHV